jgi:polyhydroxybutyrate depolymerase
MIHVADGKMIDGKLNIDGRERTFTMHLPARTSDEIPLVVVLHGNMPGAGGSVMRSITTFDDQADALGCAVAYPDGVGGCWADGRGVTTADEAGVDDVAFLREFISWSAATHGTFPDRAIVAGLSNGAIMAHLMGVTASDQVAVIVAVSGGLPERVRDELPAPSHAVSALLIHGTADPISPLEGGYSRHRGPNGELRGRTVSLEESAAFWRDVDKCPADKDPRSLGAQAQAAEARAAQAQAAQAVTTRTHSTQLSMRTTTSGGVGGTCVSAWTVYGGGHTWPGSEPWPGFEEATTQEFDAAGETCRFALPLLVPATARRLLSSPGSRRRLSLRAKAHAVEGPERLGVDKGAGHPRLVAGQAGDLEGGRRDPQRRRAESQRVRALEAARSVVGRVTLKEDERDACRPGCGKRMLDEPGADAAALESG